MFTASGDVDLLQETSPVPWSAFGLSLLDSALASFFCGGLDPNLEYYAGVYIGRVRHWSPGPWQSSELSWSWGLGFKVRDFRAFDSKA